MAFDLAEARRILRRASGVRLQRRDDVALPFVGDAPATGGGIVLDTSVYIDRLQGKLPEEIETFGRRRVTNHSASTLQELLFTVGRLSPDDHRTSAAIDQIEKLLDLTPSHRLFAPDAEVLADAAVHAGILARTQGYAKDDQRRALSDCTLFLQALKLGLTVLTRNLRDFDLLLQLRPEGRVLFYRV